MPEGDSYTRAALRIRPVLVNRQVVAVGGSAPAIRRRSRQLLDATVTEVRTFGKHLLIDTDADLTVHVHLGMPGRVRVTAGQPTGHGLRASLTTERGSVAIFAAPTVDVNRRRVIDRSLERLGPDLLADRFDWGAFEERASRYRADAPISDLLLDQRVVAGIGNEYKSEVLFLEGIDPSRPVGTVENLPSLMKRARRLMLANAERPVRNTTGRRGADSWVYGRSGEPCRKCGSPIEAASIGDPMRITFWCPLCQA